MVVKRLVTESVSCCTIVMHTLHGRDSTAPRLNGKTTDDHIRLSFAAAKKRWYRYLYKGSAPRLADVARYARAGKNTIQCERGKKWAHDLEQLAI